jgi:cytochrome c
MTATPYALHWMGFAVLAGSFLTAAALAESDTSTSAGGAAPQVAYNNHCRTCHAIAPGDHRLGPSLHGVVGRKAGSVEGFAYSPGFKTTDLVWTKETLDQFIANPNAVFPGSNMATFAGLTDAGDRKAIVDYLASLK